LKADVHGFASLMRSGADAPVRKALEDAVKRWGQGATIIESRGGDALVIVHDDPVTLAQTARQIMDEVYQAPGQPRLRMALHHGEVQMRERDLVPVIAGGDAILCAARAEPPVQGPDGGDRFNVKKEGGPEPDLWVRFYRLEL